jgi:hypothetical protein
MYIIRAIYVLNRYLYKGSGTECGALPVLVHEYEIMRERITVGRLVVG